MAKLGLLLFGNYLIALLPCVIGKFLVDKVNSIRATKGRDAKEFRLPEALDGTIRKVGIDHSVRHQFQQAFLSPAST